MANKKQAEGVSIFGLPDKTYSVRFSHVNVRAHSPKNRPAEMVFDLQMKLVASRQELDGFVHFSDLYQTPAADLLEFDADGLTAREAVSIQYSTHERLYNLWLDNWIYTAQHGITLTAAELSENKAVLNPTCTLILSVKGIPFEMIDQLPANCLFASQQIEFRLKSNLQLQEEDLVRELEKKPAAKKPAAKKAGPETAQLEMMPPAEAVGEADKASEPVAAAKPKRSHHKKKPDLSVEGGS